MEPASGPLIKWASTPEKEKGRSGKSITPLNLNVLEKLPPKEDAAPLTGFSSEEKTSHAPRVKPLDFSKLDQMGRKPSPPRTLEVQRQRIMAKRELSLGNVSDAVIPHSPKDSPKGTTPSKESPLSLSSSLKRGGILFDREFTSFMEKRLKEHRHTILVAGEIEKLAHGFVHNAVDAIFIDEEHPEQFCMVTIREDVQVYAKAIHEVLISCQVLVSPLVERLNFLKSETIQYINKKQKSTTFSDNLLQYLDLLIDAHKLQAFLDIYRKITWDVGILHLGREACGPNMKECLETWNAWLVPNKFHSLQSPFIHNVLDNMALTKLPGKLYKFPEKIDPLPIINSIGCYEISRCLYCEGRPNYSGIVFVGESVNYLKRVNIQESKDSEADFFTQIFYHLHELGYPKSKILKAPLPKDAILKDEDFYTDMEIFMFFRKLNLKPLQKYLKEGGTDFIVMEGLVGLPFVNSRVFAVLYNRHSLNAENILGVLPAYFIPSMYVLQRASMTSWNIGHEYFMKKFKDLFIFPYWTRLTSDIKIEFRKDGHVVHSKTYQTGKKVDEESFAFDPSFDPILVSFKWHAIDNAQPYFELISITIPASVNWKDKWNIIKSMIETTPEVDIKIPYINDRLAALGVK